MIMLFVLLRSSANSDKDFTFQFVKDTFQPENFCLIAYISNQWTVCLGLQ